MTAVAAPRSEALDAARPLSIAVLAMGGQGGGVLVDWIVALAESQGWAAQSTSVPGVAQRTGATVYYIECLPLPPGAPPPVLSLMAVPGEVDVVIGAELMEAGRAIQRGLVTPDRTTLIASSHRAYAMAEKQAPGDGIGDAAAVYAAGQAAAQTFVAVDMAALAEEAGSAISAVLLGALAAVGTLPFPRAAYEATIRAAGIGVEPSLRGFAAGHARVTAERSTGRPPAPPPAAAARKQLPALAPIGHPAFDALVVRAQTEFPPAVHGMIAAGLRRVVDFQDAAYGGEYLDVLSGLLALDRSVGGEARGFALTGRAAKYIAVAMAYDDVFQVADLKTRGSRFVRVHRDIGLRPGQLVEITEFMHPRMAEVLGALPVRLGRALEGRPGLLKALDRVVSRGRRVRTGTLGWFLLLYLLGGLKRFRRATLRHAIEVAHRDAWLGRVMTVAARDYAMAVELIETRRLIKGYSDTHARGQSKFDRVMAAVDRLDGRPDAAAWIRRLREAALRDEEGAALDGAIRTIESFA
jgi:indolepyruvate ferredoxin oxidoreductase, beta subunit